jgi:hypothetical protein
MHAYHMCACLFSALHFCSLKMCAYTAKAGLISECGYTSNSINMTAPCKFTVQLAKQHDSLCSTVTLLLLLLLPLIASG